MFCVCKLKSGKGKDLSWLQTHSQVFSADELSWPRGGFLITHVWRGGTYLPGSLQVPKVNVGDEEHRLRLQVGHGLEIRGVRLLRNGCHAHASILPWTPAKQKGIKEVTPCVERDHSLGTELSLVRMLKNTKMSSRKPLDFLRNSFLSSSRIFLSAPWERHIHKGSEGTTWWITFKMSWIFSVCLNIKQGCAVCGSVCVWDH